MAFPINPESLEILRRQAAARNRELATRRGQTPRVQRQTRAPRIQPSPAPSPEEVRELVATRRQPEVRPAGNLAQAVFRQQLPAINEASRELLRQTAAASLFVPPQPPGAGLPNPPRRQDLAFLSPAAAQAARSQGIAPSAIIPPFTIQQPPSSPSLGRQLFPGLDTTPPPLPENLVGSPAPPAPEGPAPPKLTFGQILGEFVGRFTELGLRSGGLPPATAGPTVEIQPLRGEPWWLGMPGGPGLFDEVRMGLSQGKLIVDVTPQLQKALGWTDTAMRQAGYVFDSLSGKWVLPESEDIGAAQASLGGGGRGGTGAGTRVGSPGVSVRFPSGARSAGGGGLINWRI